MTVKPIPEGYHSVTPYLIVKGGADAIEFYKKAFGATELFRFPAPGGKIGHAEIKIGDSPIMLADEFPEMGHKAPQSEAGSPVGLMIYVDDVDSSAGGSKSCDDKNLHRCFPGADTLLGRLLKHCHANI